jgi:hypothetical protein
MHISYLRIWTLLACYAKDNAPNMFPSCLLVSLTKVNNVKWGESMKYAFIIIDNVVYSNKPQWKQTIVEKLEQK